MSFSAKDKNWCLLDNLIVFAESNLRQVWSPAPKRAVALFFVQT